jgi:hypothetical protein
VKPAAYLEVGAKRVFAGAIDWPGWCRSARDENGALETLVAYGARYAAAVAPARSGFKPPRDPSAVTVVERLKGNATTDFGAPGVAPKADARSVDAAELTRLARLLRACWAAFDAAAEAARGKALRKGPRGGGRELDAIVAHVLEADRAYLSRLGGTHRKADGRDAAAEMTAMRDVFLKTLASRARGEPSARTRGKVWSPRYAVRRSAWHALDHAWEIEDRASESA